jgi:hypothetical protein
LSRYYFHITDDQTMCRDENGLCLPSPTAALNEARISAWALMCDLAQDVADWSKWRAEVPDEQRTTIVLPFHRLFARRPAPKLRTSFRRPAGPGSCGLQFHRWPEHLGCRTGFVWPKRKQGLSFREDILCTPRQPAGAQVLSQQRLHLTIEP